ncbi:hypothetical protein GI374_11090 [Paracoccus sp. S-4012]|uniref:universal stress protein n=1 Tax=Paracoccus sp. S-4012 TaxID=2665648 RepID=UPI0012B00E5E|nr:universal stress protein [Paracoccus sp. S-4012]MRX50981.1 hypothetical protein [Paracoccus sp. S-4012]
MAVKRILVVYSNEAGQSGALQIAVDLARRTGAQLSGVVVRGPTELEDQMARQSAITRRLSRGLLQVLKERDEETTGDIRTVFETRMTAEGLTARSDFIDLNWRRGIALAELARSYDLVIMGRRAGDIGAEYFREGPDEVALSSGRPLILAPLERVAMPERLHAVLAWDGKRAAARAVGDAIHVLELCGRISVLSVGDAPPAPAEDEGIVRLLQAHGIEAERLHRHEVEGGISGTILMTCHDLRADLLIMGAYQHSKLRAEFLGGPTRDILEDADLPVFMSH